MNIMTNRFANRKIRFVFAFFYVIFAFQSNLQNVHSLQFRSQDIVSQKNSIFFYSIETSSQTWIINYNYEIIFSFHVIHMNEGILTNINLLFTIESVDGRNIYFSNEFRPTWSGFSSNDLPSSMTIQMIIIVTSDFPVNEKVYAIGDVSFQESLTSSYLYDQNRIIITEFTIRTQVGRIMRHPISWTFATFIMLLVIIYIVKLRTKRNSLLKREIEEYPQN